MTPYRHYRTGGLYTLVGEAFDADAQRLVVIYRPAGASPYKLFTRPKEEFFSAVDLGDGETTPRFRPIEITLYGHNECAYCLKAKELLAQRGLDYTEVNVREDERARELVYELCDARGVKRTVPQIVIGHEHIGGYDDLRAFLAK